MGADIVGEDQVKWLHVSDFHVGKDGYGQRKLFDQIIDHVAGHAKDRAPNFVFITGDIANSGRLSEYEEFLERFLVPLVECLGPDWNGRILSVPGNHDVDRAKAQFFSPQEILNGGLSFFDPSKEGRDRRAQFLPRFTSFTELDVTGAPKKWIEDEHGSYSITSSISDTLVQVVGINTAWLSKDDKDRNRLSPGSNILEDALALSKSAHLRIVLGHHPIEWFDDQEG